MLWIFVVSIASAMVIGGRMVGNRFAIIDLPEPGGPIISKSYAVTVNTKKYDKRRNRKHFRAAGYV
jgi:hypothetical protein